MRLALLALVASAVMATPATAATRHAVPTGTYERGSATLSIKSGVTYQGAGAGAARPLITGTSTLFLGSPADVVVRDLRFVTPELPLTLRSGSPGLIVLERVTMRRTQNSFPFIIRHL